MNRSREHKFKMLQLLTQPRLGSDSFHSGRAQYTVSGLLITEHFFQMYQVGQDCQQSPSGLPPQHMACHQHQTKTSNLLMAMCFKMKSERLLCLVCMAPFEQYFLHVFFCWNVIFGDCPNPTLSPSKKYWYIRTI